MTLNERLAKLYNKGYRYCIEFEQSSNIEPLAVKQMTQIAPLIREQFPNEKNWAAWEFDQNGNKIQKWTPTNNENFFLDN